MKFNIVYIETTNICGLSCSFCPPKINPTATMSLEFFENILQQVKPYTSLIALHVLGDPLVVSNLDKYLDIVKKYDLKVMITTTGYYLSDEKFELLTHPSIKQINFSLNSFNKNAMNMTLQEYLNKILLFCDYKVRHNINSFINLRLWNQDEQNSQKQFNHQVYEILEDHFDIDLHHLNNIQQSKYSQRLGNKVLLHFDQYFIWPSLKNKIIGDGYCHGLSSQIAILSDGKVVPCCLDCEGIMNLGNMHQKELKYILNGSRALNIINGFKEKKAVEPLCQRCGYKNRFKI